MLLGFEKLSFVDSVKEGERVRGDFNDRRQMVSVIVIKPDGKAVAFCMAENANAKDDSHPTNDGLLNLTPPQGKIRRQEPLFGAAIRVVNQELGVGVGSAPYYLGSVVRVLPEDHRRAKYFREYHHHWVAIFADIYNLKHKPSFCKSHWYPLDVIDHVAKTSMSEDKGAMVLLVMKVLTDLSRNRFQIRRKDLQSNSSVAAA